MEYEFGIEEYCISAWPFVNEFEKPSFILSFQCKCKSAILKIIVQFDCSFHVNHCRASDIEIWLGRIVVVKTAVRQREPGVQGARGPSEGFLQTV